ncbi:DNA-directed RNA polymerases I, II, and III subunit RPABC2 isoform X4 [Halichoerus grypus]
MLLRPTPHWLLENAPGMEAPRTCVWFSPLPKGPLPLLLGEGFGGGLPSGASACILPSPPRHVGLQRKNFRKATLCNKEGTSSGENALPVSKRRQKGDPPTGRPDPGCLLALRQDTLPQPPSCLSRAQQPPRRESPPAFRRWRLRGSRGTDPACRVRGVHSPVTTELGLGPSGHGRKRMRCGRDGGEEQETEAQRGEVICLRPRGWAQAQAGDAWRGSEGCLGVSRGGGICRREKEDAGLPHWPLRICHLLSREDTEPQGKHRTRALPGGCAPQNPGCRPSLLSRPAGGRA